MIICNYGNNFNYELEKLTRLFLPFERIDVVNQDVSSDRKAVTVTKFNDNLCEIYAELFIDGCNYISEATVNKCDNFIKLCQLKLADCLFDCLSKAFDYIPSWGILTGVRPARLYIATLNKIGIQNTDKYFKEILRVTDSKLSLLKETAISEQKIISLSDYNSCSLYISIPFCPTRCSYCSFVSHSVEKAADIIPQYLQKLYRELEETANIINNLSLKIETVYIGGGTPTTLTPLQLDNLISYLKSKFDLSSVHEFTVECGRPDTISRDKLTVLKEHNVDRICINPQTLNDRVLAEIGRKHTVRQFYDAFSLARDIGFNSINTDIIAGLPGETFGSFKDTVDNIIYLSPESVTVHTLSMKRSSTMSTNGFRPLVYAGTLASEMVDYAREKLINDKILPYYMYRQSKTVGNLENVGYAKQGFESLYNVFIIDETHTIFACGASAATKLKNPFNGEIKRIFNFKFPYEYISRFDEQMARKKEIYGFYNFL